MRIGEYDQELALELIKDRRAAIVRIVGEERLIESLRRHSALPPRELLAAIVDDVHQFSPEEQYDDITLIVAKCL